MMCAVVLDGPPINSVTVTVETMVAASGANAVRAAARAGALLVGWKEAAATVEAGLVGSVG